MQVDRTKKRQPIEVVGLFNNEGNDWVKKEVIGSLIQFPEAGDEYFFVHKAVNCLGWCVSDLKTGMYLEAGETKNEAIFFTRQKLITRINDWERIRENAAEKLKAYGIELPINNLF